MAERVEGGSGLRAEALGRCVRGWKELLSNALAEREALAAEERVEHLVGYLDPQPCWDAVATEMARAFSGATARLEDSLEELASFLDTVALHERALGCARSVIDRVQSSVEALRGEADRAGIAFAEALEDLDGAVEMLDRLGRALDAPGHRPGGVYAESTRPTRPATSDS